MHYKQWKNRHLRFFYHIAGTNDLEIYNFFNLFSFDFSIKTGYFYEQIKEAMNEMTESDKYLFLYKLQMIADAYEYIKVMTNAGH